MYVSAFFISLYRNTDDAGKWISTDLVAGNRRVSLDTLNSPGLVPGFGFNMEISLETSVQMTKQELYVVFE